MDTHKSTCYRTFLLLFITALFAAKPALAGGLEEVQSFMTSILTILHGVSLSVVTIAIMWAGYKFLFRKDDISECAKILGGGLLIGAAAELAAYIVG